MLAASSVRSVGSVTHHRRRNGELCYRARITRRGRTMSLGLFPFSPKGAAAAERAIAAAAERLGVVRELTLRQWGVEWLDIRETDTIHRGVTRERSAWRARIMTAPFADRPLRSITRGDVVQLVNSLLKRYARSSVNAALVLLRGALHAAADAEHIAENPAATVRVPKRARDDDGWDWLREKEIRKLFRLELRPDQRAIFTVAIYAGLRAGELWGLRWCDVTLDGKRPELHVRRSYRGPTKGGRPRHVPLLPVAVAALHLWRSQKPGVGEALVFPADPHPRGKSDESRRGGGCHHSGHDAGWPAVVRRLKLGRRMRFHDLRHTGISHWVMGTFCKPLSLRRAQAWAGHRSITTTERYAHFSPEWVHEANG